jgi:DNA primase
LIQLKNILTKVRSISGVELKEFSLLYLLLNNLSFFQANIHLVENIKLFTEINKQIFNSIIDRLKSGEQMSIESLNLDKQLLDKINKFAPIKHILKNKLDNEDQVIELLDDISKDLFNYDLEFRIQELESKFSKDMSETTFNELKELKNERKIN